MKIVTAAEMREIDRRTVEEFGVPSLTLMENAGAAVAEFCLQQYGEAKRVGVICGKGNNGGDGLVCARKLHQAGKSVSVLLLADPAEVEGDAAEMLKRLPLQPVVTRNEEELKGDAAQQVFEAELLIDAILGTGFKPPLQGLYRAAIERLWDCGAARIVAVDLPSGVDADSTEILRRHGADGAVVPAHAAVTFTAPRPAHVFAFPRLPIVVAAIGSPAEAIRSKLGLELITRTDLLPCMQPRDPASNKGDFGHVLVVGGSRGKAGAAAMAGLAALRAGAGLCTVATPRSVQDLVSSFAPELMTEDLAETDRGTVALHALDLGRMDEILRAKTVLAVGPGISRHPGSAEFVRTLVHRRRAPMVLDADGLNAFEGHDERLEGSGVPLVLTPHPGEMARLARVSTAEVQKDRVGTARKFAHDHDCFVVLKGHRTLVAEPGGTVAVNTTGNPGMASGGTGDVLTGMIAGLIAQFPQQIGLAIRMAVHWHGLAGDIARDSMGEASLIATDVLAATPHALYRLQALIEQRFVWVTHPAG